MLIQPPAPKPARRIFHLPKEHGAWWTFETCLAAGLLQAYARHQAMAAALSLGAGMHALFLCSDWFTHLGRSRRGAWLSLPGWLLSLAGLSLLATGIALAPSPLQKGLAGVLALWGLFAALVLWMRVHWPARDLRLLMCSGVLLTGPSLILGGLGLGAWGPQALCYWAPWAWYFASGVLYIQTWLRGNTLPRWRIQAASLPFLVLASLLAIFSGWLGASLVFALGVRVLWRLRLRLQEFDHSDGQPHLASSPREIRSLGYEQLAWSLLLSGLWMAAHW
jgi:hypothetical protein